MKPHYHIVLVESMTHLKEMGSLMEEWVDDLVRMANLQARWSDDVHYFTIVNFYRTNYRVFYNERASQYVRMKRKLFFEEDGDKYAAPSSGLYTLQALAEQVEACHGREARVSFHVASDGYDILSNVDIRAWKRQMESLEQAGWEFDFYMVSPYEHSIRRASSWLCMLSSDKNLQFELYVEEVRGKISTSADRPVAESEQTGFDRLLELQDADPDRPFTLGGIEYLNFEDFRKKHDARMNFYYELNRDFDVRINHRGQLYLEYSRLYPCFDSYDYANENRYHRNYWLCCDMDDARKKCAYITEHLRPANDSYAECPMPRWLGPAIFTDDGSGMFKVAY